MRLLQVEITNFRGVRSGIVRFPGHALLVGQNNAGKSTVFEALDLALGPDRATGAGGVDEHDFYKGKYTATEGVEAPTIRIMVTLGGLTPEELKRFRSNAEVWNATESRLARPDELVEGTPGAEAFVLRIECLGWYDAEEEEFQAKSFFASPEAPDLEREPVSKSNKRAIGFLYLRSIRTARRAASLQRGSLLDLLMKLTNAEPRFWEELIAGLGELGAKVSGDVGVRSVLTEIEKELASCLPRPDGPDGSQLNVSQLTREHLRTVMTFFLKSYEEGHPLPYDHLGSGMSNVLVFALLALIAKQKSNVIFAMEEPEIALGPTVQRRVVARLRTLSAQMLLTSHSPYVAEQLLPDQIVTIRRNDSGVLSSAAVTATPLLKEKILRADFRRRFAEGLLGSVVVPVEGITELYALPAASDVLADVELTQYRSLDLVGAIPVNAEGAGNLAMVSSYFMNANIPSHVFSDQVPDAPTEAQVRAVSTTFHAHAYGSFEELMTKELSPDVLRRELVSLCARADYPTEVRLPAPADADSVWRKAMYDALDKRKGYGYSALVIKNLRPEELPISLRRYLVSLHKDVVGAPLAATDPVAVLAS